jgi:hypothetical protein
MAASRALRRLLRVLNIQEEQTRTALESALAELHRVERAQASVRERERGGRLLVAASVLSGELPEQVIEQLLNRLAGLEESLAASRAATVLAPYAAEAHENVTLCREEFLLKRVERRQAESLVHSAAAADAVEAGRRSQQFLDDWYLNRLHHTKLGKAAGQDTRRDAGKGE